MTEAEWLVSEDPAAMLRVVTGEAEGPHAGGVISPRKLRLFACACCRHPGVWPLLTDPRSRRAVEVAERYADGEADNAELLDAEGQASESELVPHEVAPSDLPSWVARSDAMHAAEVINQYGTRAGIPDAARAALLREIVGNPWRPIKKLHRLFGEGQPDHLPGNLDTCFMTETVRGIAGRAYESRDWAALPILADALEDAGCTNAGILGHLRGPGPHCRGCWALDLLLGKE